MSLSVFRKDFVSAMQRAPALRYFCYDDIRMQYRRTLLGPLWVVCGTGLWIMGISLVLSALFGHEISEFLPYTAAGMFVWVFIALPLVDGCGVFVGASGLIHSMRAPLLFHALRTLARYVVLYAHYLAICILILLLTGHSPGVMALLAIPGIIIQILIIFGLLLIMGIGNARYRDIAPISAVLCQIIPMMTPIAWKREMLQKYTWIADYNPIYHIIEIVRAPLLGQVPDEISYTVACCIMVVCLAAGIWLYSQTRHKLIFWI